MDKQNIFYNLANAVFILRIPKGKTFKISLVYWYVFLFHLGQSAITEFLVS